MVSLFKSIHILPFQLDWIHFGFGTAALGREFVADVLGAKMAVSFRGFDIAIYPLKNPDCYQLVWRMSDKIHVISDDLAHLVHEQGYPKTKPLIKITPAIDVKYFARKIEPQILRNPVRFVTVARLHWKKGLEYTLEALALLKEKGIDFVYTLVGEGEEYERLIFAAHQLGVVQNINYVGKLLPEEVVKVLGEADIYIQYSIQEGFCNAVLEAQAMSLLCVVSDAEGLAENVVHGDTGWVVPKRKPQLLADQLTGILQQSPDRLEKIRNQARDRVQNKFSVQEQCQSFLKFYEIQTSI